MTRRFGLVLLGLLILSTPAKAVDFCSMESVLSSYKSALTRQNLGDYEGAKPLLENLANIGFAPAQRHLSHYFRDESRADMAPEMAGMWARLAAWGGDREAQRTLEQLNASFRHVVVENAHKLAKDWTPVQQACSEVGDLDEKEDDYFYMNHVPVLRADEVAPEDFLAIQTRLLEAYFIRNDIAPKFSSLIDLMPAIEVVAGEKTERFLKWDADRERFLLSLSYLNDQTVRQLSYALVLAVQRTLYNDLKDMRFADPIARNFGKIKIYGSLYGDVKTRRYLDIVEEAVKLSHKIPTVLHDKVYQLDEIHYMPPSKFHMSRLDRFKPFMSYDYSRSTSGRRLARVNHRINFEDADTVLLELVRMGTYAQYHTRIEGLRQNKDSKQREEAILQVLEGKKGAMSRAFSPQIAKKDKLVEEWDKFGPTQNAELTCEATVAQTRTAIALNMSDTKVSRTIKFKGCAKAKELWQKRQ